MSRPFVSDVPLRPVVTSIRAITSGVSVRMRLRVPILPELAQPEKAHVGHRLTSRNPGGGSRRLFLLLLVERIRGGLAPLADDVPNRVGRLHGGP